MNTEGTHLFSYCLLPGVGFFGASFGVGDFDGFPGSGMDCGGVGVGAGGVGLGF